MLPPVAPEEQEGESAAAPADRLLRCAMRAFPFLLLLHAAAGDLLAELIAADKPEKVPVQARPVPRGCYEWCHWQWMENCLKPQCQACERCGTLFKPHPPPNPPSDPGFQLPAYEYYFPSIDFEVVDGAIYAEGKYFVMKGISWYESQLEFLLPTVCPPNCAVAHSVHRPCSRVAS